MKEVSFIHQNSAKWKKFEESFSSMKNDPDFLIENYSQLIDDLSFSSTFYPGSTTTKYLNSLLVKCNSGFHDYRAFGFRKIKSFWTRRQPAVIFKHRRLIFLAAVITAAGILIGAVSAANDDTFLRLILGERYLKMTVENIQNNDPMKVYRSMSQMDMFLAITANNIRVAFTAFVFGIFLSFGTGYILLQNGVMLGAFHFLFYRHDLLLESFLTVWMHGSLEIPAIIVSGAAGLVIGNSFLFPGTFSRLDSLKSGAREGIDLIIGIIPVFLIAAFLEGFVTSQVHVHVWRKVLIITVNFLLIIWLYILKPGIYTRRKKNEISQN
ncbi:MAG: stage II sporulation protein M [Spirochaetes bacterium]|nr:stage II sporulation protein M [Spirochaetota bacterium]